MVGPQLQRRLEAVDRFPGSAEVTQGHPTIGEGGHVVRRQRQGLVVALQRLVQPAQPHQGVAATVPGVRQAGVLPHGPVVGRERGGQLVQAAQHHRQPGPADGVLRPAAQGGGEQLAGLGETTAFLLEEAQQPQRIQMSGLGRQHRPIEPAGLVLGPGLVPLQRLLEQFVSGLIHGRGF